MLFFQLFDSSSSTYTYLLGDAQTQQALLIDPVFEQAPRDLTLIKQLGLRLRYCLETHIHADHISGSAYLAAQTGATCVLGAATGLTVPHTALRHGETLALGGLTLKALATPGHTPGCTSYLLGDRVFTGDALLLGSCGRTDFQDGSAAALYHSITNVLYALPDDCRIYPGHNYQGLPYSTIGLQKRYNTRIPAGISQAQFEETMSQLSLSPPARLQESLRANQTLGYCSVIASMQPTSNAGIAEVQPAAVAACTLPLRLIDVRTAEEFTGELGHIASAQLATLGPELLTSLQEIPRETEIVFVCRSGGRSLQATALSLEMGFERVANLQGGMLRWQREGLPTA